MKPTLHGRILAQGARREKQTRRDSWRRAARCRRDAKVLLMISTVLIKVPRINQSTGNIPLHICREIMYCWFDPFVAASPVRLNA
jgi:hypothetical protein